MISRDLRLMHGDLLEAVLAIMQNDSNKAVSCIWLAQERLERLSNFIDQAEEPIRESAWKAAQERVNAYFEKEAKRALQP